MRRLILLTSLCLMLFAGCDGNKGNNNNNNGGWNPGGGNPGGGNVDYGKAETAVFPEGAKSIFTPKSDTSSVNSMVAAMEAAGFQFMESRNVNAAEDVVVENSLVPNVLYATLADGTSKEIVFDSSTGHKIRVEVEGLTDVGEGYLSAKLGKTYLVMEATDKNGSKYWVNPYETSDYVKMGDTNYPYYCLKTDVRDDGRGGQYCSQPIHDYMATDGRKILIDPSNGKIYDLTGSGFKYMDKLEVVNNYAYFTGNRSGDYRTNAYYKIDLGDMKHYQINDPKYDETYDYSAVFKEGDVLTWEYYNNKIFPGDNQNPYVLELDNLTAYYNWKMPALSDTVLAEYYLKPLNGKDYDGKPYYGYNRNSFTSLTTIPADETIEIKTGRSASAIGNLFGGNYYYNLISRGYSPYRGYEYDWFRGADGEIYALSLQTYFEENTTSPTPPVYDHTFPNNMACKGDLNNPYYVSDCYAGSFYAVLSRIYLKDHKILKREEVTKEPIGSESDAHSFRGVASQNFRKNAQIQRSSDNSSFYEVDTKTKTIKKTAWRGSEIFKNINVEKTKYYGNSGIAWMAENGNGIWFIPYEENATPKKVVTANVAGSISVDGDYIYYTERFNAVTFKTRVQNMKTGKVTTVSESQLSTGNIIELSF